jgi:hypothetical protein
MLDTYIKNRGMTKTIVHKNNHNTINETNWDADYDGSVANVSLDLSKNGRNKHMDFKLTNDDLANILSIPSVNQPIHKRLKMDFKKPQSSFEKIFLELDPDSDSSSSSDSDSDSSSDSDSEVPFKRTDTPFYNDKKISSPLEVQELLTHISSPMPNEEFIMPFQDYSLDKQPVIKIVHTPSTKRHRKKSSSRKVSGTHRVRHHNYPSIRKSSKRKSSKRKSSRLSKTIPKYL